MAVLSPLGFSEMIKEGMTVVIKANLVSAMKPEEAATTHPVLLAALTDMLVEKGAKVIVGDSPGGLIMTVCPAVSLAIRADATCHDRLSGLLRIHGRQPGRRGAELLCHPARVHGRVPV